MLWLTLVLNIPHSTARIINLLFFIPSALIASIFRWKQGSISLRKILPAIAAGSISAAIFATASKHMDTAVLKKMFGILLIVIGLRELLYKPAKKR